MADDALASEQSFPTSYMREAYLRRFPLAAAQRLETVFTLRSVSQQINNVLNEWLEGTAGSPSRFQTLALLWAAGDRYVPHQEIIAALQVKRATVSALMFSLEQEGLVQSIGDENDRRRLLATLTEKGKSIIASALELNAQRLEKVLAGLSPDELQLLQSLLRRMRDGFIKVSDEKTKA
ncbi:MarR family transcriptional regulator [Dyella dinghuensis]|uniref:MarR family transcriptional regulator n=1 Tax=Dyella dinghuensis TaxID=1920169 RepID=A0A3S0PE07_9GAMM|nr:MarR family transcriptional regulator [Dyella dinghuensis]RUL66491.1 MarR family transcriptional regulator [Dyella dinghuensis]